MPNEVPSGMSKEMEIGLAQMEQIKDYMENLNLQRDSLRAALMDYQRAEEVVMELKRGGGEDLLIPIGGFILARGEIKEKNSLILDRGAGVLVDTGLEQALDLIKERRSRVEKAVDSIEKSLNEMASRYGEISDRTQKLYRDQITSGQGPKMTF
ncbi:MAG: prefoldin subunit alpha [Thermoplasmatota archaeon]